MNLSTFRTESAKRKRKQMLCSTFALIPRGYQVASRNQRSESGKRVAFSSIEKQDLI